MCSQLAQLVEQCKLKVIGRESTEHALYAGDLPLWIFDEPAGEFG